MYKTPGSRPLILMLIIVIGTPRNYIIHTMTVFNGVTILSSQNQVSTRGTFTLWNNTNTQNIQVISFFSHMPVILLHALDLCHENNYYIFSTDLKSMFVNLLMNDTFFSDVIKRFWVPNIWLKRLSTIEQLCMILCWNSITLWPMRSLYYLFLNTADFYFTFLCNI